MSATSAGTDSSPPLSSCTRSAPWGVASARVAFGADGLDRSVLPQPGLVIAYGKTVWPHKLVRVMLAEQLYRGVSILAGMPYHRD